MIWTAQKGMHDGVYLTVQWCHHHSALRMPQLCLLRAAVRERTCSNQSIKKLNHGTCVISKRVKYLNTLKKHRFLYNIQRPRIWHLSANCRLEMNELSS